EVAVDDAGPASGLERLGQLTADVNDARRREPSIDGHFMERAALDVFHRQEHATAVFTKLIDRTEVRVPQALQNAAFEVKTVLAADVVRGVRRQDLQGHEPFPRQIPGQLHVAHAAMTEDLLDDVATDLRARVDGRRN